MLMVHLPITGLSFKGCRLSRGKAAQQQKQPVRSKHARVRKPASAIVLSWPSVVSSCRICSRLIYRKSGWKRIWSVEGSEESPRLSYMSWMQLHVQPRPTAEPIWFFCWQNGLFGKNFYHSLLRESQRRPANMQVLQEFPQSKRQQVRRHPTLSNRFEIKKDRHASIISLPSWGI